MSQGITEPIPDYPIVQPEIPPVMPEEQPALVRVITEETAYRDHALFNVPITSPSDVKPVLGPDDKRTRYRTYLLNTHATDGVVILRGKTEQAFGGFLLPAGQGLEDFSHGPFYAVLPAAGANPVTLSVLTEYESEPVDSD